MAKNERVFTNCTSGGPVRVHVKNGKMVRVEPLTFESSEGDWVIKARGRTFSPEHIARISPYTVAERSRTYGDNRLLHPLKRVDFNPSGDRKAENRGKSAYREISWDEALDLLSAEVVRIQRDYGPGAIITTSSSHHNWGHIGYRFSAYARFMSILGAMIVEHNPDSWEGWHWGSMHHWGFSWRLGLPEQYDLLEDALKHTELIVFWSSDPEATAGIYSGQESTLRRFWLKELGIEMVFIDPFYNFTAMNFSDKWLAPRPGTDSALAAAIAYIWIEEELYDQEYVQKRTYGFDKWKDYLLGKEDGTPKTAEWAEKETGISAREIRALSRKWGKKRTMLAAGGVGGWGGACRAAYGTEWSRMMVLLAAMQGMGKPGSNIWSTTQGAPYNAKFYFPGYTEGGMVGTSTLVTRGMVTQPVRNTLNDAQGAHVPRILLPECVLEGKATWRGKGFCGERTEAQFKAYHYPEKGFSEIKMFWRYGGSYIGTMNNTNRWIKMYRSPKLEFVVNQSVYFEGEAKFADLILPACSNFERNDIGEWAAPQGYGLHKASGLNHRIIVLQSKCIEPLGESKSDYEIFSLAARKLGFYEKYTQDGTSEYEWVKRMFAASDVAKYISWRDFENRGYFVVPLPKGYKSTPALRWFAEGRKKDTPDPGPNGSTLQGLPDSEKALDTQTGKIEFEALSLKRFAPDDSERPPVPQYIPSWEGHHTRSLFKKYPIQLITPHPRYSFHTMNDGKGGWINEIPEHRVKAKDGYYYWVIRINPKDARKRGIQNNDIVKAYNDRGAVLLSAQLTERMRPGTAHSFESSANYEPLGEPGESPDRGGCINLITPHRYISQNACGQAPNSCLIEIEKWPENRV